jgi:hypothetical protein
LCLSSSLSLCSSSSSLCLSYILCVNHPPSFVSIIHLRVYLSSSFPKYSYVFPYYILYFVPLV